MIDILTYNATVITGDGKPDRDAELNPIERGVKQIVKSWIPDIPVEEWRVDVLAGFTFCHAAGAFPRRQGNHKQGNVKGFLSDKAPTAITVVEPTVCGFPPYNVSCDRYGIHFNRNNSHGPAATAAAAHRRHQASSQVLATRLIGSSRPAHYN